MTHAELATRCLPWLQWRATGSGYRGACEVRSAPGYVADVVALCSFQNRFRQQYVSDADLPLVGGVGVLPEFACVFEVKVSRADFFATFGLGRANGHHANRLAPVGSLHWCVTPRAMVKVDDLADGWGLLEVRGPGLMERHPPRYSPCSRTARHAIAYALLWRGKWIT